MIEFSCECGRKLKVSEDLAGWQTQCPGCQRLIPVPSLDTPEEPVVEKPGLVVPWKGTAIGASCVAVLAILVAVLSGGSKPPDEEHEHALSRFKKQLAERDQEIETLIAEKARLADAAKLADRLRAVEAERDQLRRQLDAALRSRAEDPGAGTAKADKPAPPPPAPVAGTPPPPPAPASNADKPGSTGLKESDFATFEPAEILERHSGAILLVSTDRNSGGGGCFIKDDGLVLTSYGAIAGSETRIVTYITGKGEGRMRINAEAAVVAIDRKNDLALLKIPVPGAVPVVLLEEHLALGGGHELVALGNPVPGTRSIDHSLIRGKVVDVFDPSRGKKYHETSIPLNAANIGVPIFNLRGRVIGVSTQAGDASSLAAFAVPAAFVRFLLDERETTFAVRGTLREWEARSAEKGGAPVGDVPVKPHPTGIGVGGVITRFHLDEERDRIVGLDVENAQVVVMSLSKRNIVRTIPTGTDANDLQMTVNPDVAWVAHPESRLFMKMDVTDGRIFDRLEAVRFGRSVATRNHIWTYGPTSHIVTLSDKVAVSNPIKFGALTYDRRRDRIIGLVTNWDAMKLVEFDPDKVGPKLREIAEIYEKGQAHPKFDSLQSKVKDLETQWKTWTVPPRYEDWAPSGWTFSLMTDGSTRVMLNRFALKRDKLDSVVQRYPLAPVPETGAQAMMQALIRFGRLDQFQCISPDGRWIASGRHIYDADRGRIQVELPVPTPDSKFSSDSKILYVYDLSARAIVPIEVEPK